MTFTKHPGARQLQVLASLAKKPWFDFQHLCDNSPPPVTPVPEDLMPSNLNSIGTRYAHSAHIYNIHIYTHVILYTYNINIHTCMCIYTYVHVVFYMHVQVYISIVHIKQLNPRVRVHSLVDKVFG